MPKTKIVFSVKKYIENRRKDGMAEDIIIGMCKIWANKCDGKEIEIDNDGDHWIKGLDYGSDEHWEEEVEYEN